MEAQKQERLLDLVVVTLAWLFVFLGAPPSVAAHDDATSGRLLHPVVLLPGYSCSQLDARLTGEYRSSSSAAAAAAAAGCGRRKQGRGWFRLWENTTALQEDPTLLPCYADQLRLVYDHAAGDYRNLPGVDTRVVSFGTAQSFRFDDPVQRNNCMARLVEALEGVGYREGANLFGAPYDFRHAPAAPGVASAAFSGFTSALAHLVEHASATNGGRPVIFVTHSFGGTFAMEFLGRSPPAWRRRHVKHLVMLSLGVGGSPFILQSVAAAAAAATPATLLASILSFGNRSFASAFALLPSPTVFGGDAPLVITPARNYTAGDLPEFLAAAGFSGDEVERYRTRSLPLALDPRVPGVPMTSINGVGVRTVDKLIYLDGNFSANPRLVYGDGDGVVNLKTVLALDKLIGQDPNQCYFKSVLIPNMTHTGMVYDDLALKRVVSEILEASQATS
ncbi:hypothetical protein ACP4OV_023144 [Aristida adscensionis]